MLPFETGTWNWSGFLLLSQWYQAGAPYAPDQSPGRNKLKISFRMQKPPLYYNHTHTEHNLKIVFIYQQSHEICVFKCVQGSWCNMWWESCWLKPWLWTKLGRGARTSSKLCRGTLEWGPEPPNAQMGLCNELTSHPGLSPVCTWDRAPAHFPWPQKRKQKKKKC